MKTDNQDRKASIEDIIKTIIEIYQNSKGKVSQTSTFNFAEWLQSTPEAQKTVLEFSTNLHQILIEEGIESEYSKAYKVHNWAKLSSLISNSEKLHAYLQEHSSKLLDITRDFKSWVEDQKKKTTSVASAIDEPDNVGTAPKDAAAGKQDTLVKPNKDQVDPEQNAMKGMMARAEAALRNVSIVYQANKKLFIPNIKNALESPKPDYDLVYTKIHAYLNNTKNHASTNSLMSPNSAAELNELVNSDWKELSSQFTGQQKELLIEGMVAYIHSDNPPLPQAMKTALTNAAYSETMDYYKTKKELFSTNIKNALDSNQPDYHSAYNNIHAYLNNTINYGSLCTNSPAELNELVKSDWKELTSGFTEHGKELLREGLVAYIDTANPPLPQTMKTALTYAACSEVMEGCKEKIAQCIGNKNPEGIKDILVSVAPRLEHILNNMPEETQKEILTRVVSDTISPFSTKDELQAASGNKRFNIKDFMKNIAETIITKLHPSRVKSFSEMIMKSRRNSEAEGPQR